MPQLTLTEKIYSEDYADFILPIQINIQHFLSTYADMGGQSIGAGYGLIHIARSALSQNPLISSGYYNIPKLYTLLDDTSLTVSGITQVHNQPLLGYRGKDVIIGFLDTGLNFAEPLFRKKDGRTRILGFWDQNDRTGTPPDGQYYGSHYTQEEIQEALSQENPYAQIPSRDENGHGTFLASVAAGNDFSIPGFSGAAPECDLAFVKLKPAKQYLRNFFLIREDAAAFQESDLMTGLQYLLDLARNQKKPLVVCIGLGTNQGDHTGTLPLAETLNLYSSVGGFCAVIAGGNEAGRSHHFSGSISSPKGSENVEILVGADEKGFSLELWAQSPELYSIGLTSPLGESIPTIPARLGQNTSLNFTIERTRIEVNYKIVETRSGSQLILLRFQDPTPGVWTIRVENNLYINGIYHIWLPITGFLSPETVFLAPEPNTTLTNPSNASGPICVSTYHALDGSLYLHSSRGFTRNQLIKPDICSPGVDVQGLGTNGQLTLRTGSSVASAITAGAVALLFNWGMDRIYPHIMSVSEIKNFLIRGARRSPDRNYPDRAFGYGTLNVYGIFESFL